MNGCKGRETGKLSRQCRWKVNTKESKDGDGRGDEDREESSWKTPELEGWEPDAKGARGFPNSGQPWPMRTVRSVGGGPVSQQPGRDQAAREPGEPGHRMPPFVDQHHSTGHWGHRSEWALPIWPSNLMKLQHTTDGTAPTLSPSSHLSGRKAGQLLASEQHCGLRHFGCGFRQADGERVQSGSRSTSGVGLIVLTFEINDADVIRIVYTL